MGRSVAKSSSAFRIPNTEVKTSRADDTWGIAPGKVGHRQVTSEKPSLTRWSFCVYNTVETYEGIWGVGVPRSTLQENSFRDAVWR
ncbi:hypothetical protein [Desulfosporosinus hippei]|uniref:Uncharacterized protein n=1 Tax=Desulfosporosinus hippei DSM 8344 TaxID=1121419 RepID=A0A1G8LV39_9FIRM|nr:hypothetical protein [Desulfosporosinus hippei]SDI59347.1 hypothetical protein SAMN05443529_1552 [Desulfosporosinus hippei DSM 8344]